MKIINIKSRHLKINNSVKIIISMTLVIFFILIILPIMFLEIDKENGGRFNLNNCDIVKDSRISFPMNGKVKLYRKSEDKVEEIDLEEYVIGVVAGEVPANFNEEALKAQAVAARTFYMNRRINPCKDAKIHGAEVCDTTNCQVYMNKDERLAKWSSKEGNSNWEKIKKAVLDTKGQVLTYNGTVLEYPQFFAVSSGRTEDAKDVFSVDVPYLKSEESSGEEIAPKFKSTISIPINDFVSKINTKYSEAKIKKENLSSSIKVDSYTTAGSVKTLKAGKQIIKGTEFRELFNLNSANFTLEFEKETVKINCNGYGHGVGMSQWGANVMGKSGCKYNDILKHYYSGVEIKELVYQ